MIPTWKQHAYAAFYALPLLFTSPALMATQMTSANSASTFANTSTFNTTLPLKELVGGNQPLTIERIHASPALAGASPRGLSLSPDGKRVTYLAGRDSDQSFYDLWQMDIASGKRSRLIDADKLVAGELSDEEKARRERQRIYGQGIMEYFWADDSQSILIPASGQLYVFDVNTAEVNLLDTGEGFVTDARLSPKANYVSFVRDQNLFILALATKQLTALTQDGQGPIKNAMAEFVAQEEMDRMTGYWWSPDESHIAFTRHAIHFFLGNKLSHGIFNRSLAILG